MRVAVAGVPGAWSSERLADGLRAHGAESFVFSLSDCLHNLSSQTVMLHGFDLKNLDAVVVKKLGDGISPLSRLRLHMLRELADRGVTIFSKPSAIEHAMDRYRMTMMLVAAGLPIPKTIAVESEAALEEAALELQDAVVKPVYASKGRGFIRLDRTAPEATPAPNTPPPGTVLAQRFVAAPGRDIGACVLGGRFVGAFYRVAAQGQWLTTTAAGGSYAPCDLPPAGRQLAEDAAKVFGLDYTVVDLVENNGGYLIYEVSAFGGFRGLWEAYRYDVANDYARHIKCELLA